MPAFVSSVQNTLKALRRKAAAATVTFAAKGQFTASLYWLFKGGFGRELQAVLAGMIAYKESLADPTINTSQLRRNIHRLEKGLLMRPRRVPFGLDYIGETVRAYLRAVNSTIDPDELSWARDVLREYMDITPPNPRVDKLRKQVQPYLSIADGVCSASRKRVPYARDAANIPSINYNEFLSLAKYRRSVRWYLQKPVPREMIERAIEVAAYSPSACNRLPYEFRVFDDPALVSQVIKLPGGTSGFWQQVPAVAVIVGRQRNYFGPHDRHCIYTDASLAAMSFIYALEVQGLGSCCINWPDIESKEQKMASLLRLAPDERPVMLVSFGWPDPDGLVADSTKKTLPTLCKYNREHEKQ